MAFVTKEIYLVERQLLGVLLSLQKTSGWSLEAGYLHPLGEIPAWPQVLRAWIPQEEGEFRYQRKASRFIEPKGLPVFSDTVVGQKLQQGSNSHWPFYKTIAKAAVANHISKPSCGRQTTYKCRLHSLPTIWSPNGHLRKETGTNHGKQGPWTRMVILAWQWGKENSH